MKISVIVPAYNAAAFLSHTVPAVLSLDPVHEWIWVDDGSTDTTFEDLLKLTEGRSGVRVMRHETNLGRAAARNTAIEAAAGSVLAFLDADARPRSGYIQAHLLALSSADARASVGLVVPADPVPGDPYTDYLRVQHRGPHPVAGVTSWKHFLSGASCLFADDLRRLGGFNTAIAYGEDSELACRLAETWPEGLRVVPEAVLDLFGTETLVGALEKTRSFGSALPLILEACPTALQTLGLPRLRSPLAGAFLGSRMCERVARDLLTSSSPRVTAKAVRYLLGHALYDGYRNA